MNKKQTIIALAVLVIIAIIGVIVYLNFFKIGSSDYSNIQINKVTLSEDDLTIYGEFIDKDSSYKDFSYTLVGTELYVTINHVKISEDNNQRTFEINLPISGTLVSHIHLTDGKSTKVVYSAQ